MTEIQVMIVASAFTVMGTLDSVAESAAVSCSLFAVLCGNTNQILPGLPQPFTPNKFRCSSMLDARFNLSPQSKTDGS